jgi:hypothetical protein
MAYDTQQKNYIQMSVSPISYPGTLISSKIY